MQSCRSTLRQRLFSWMLNQIKCVSGANIHFSCKSTNKMLIRGGLPACQLSGSATLFNVHSQLILVAVVKPTHSGMDHKS